MSNNLKISLADYRQQQYECLTITLFANALWKDRDVLCLYHGHSLVDEKVDRLLNFHRTNFSSPSTYQLDRILDLLREISLLPHLPSIIDIGELLSTLAEKEIFKKENLIARLWCMQVPNAGQPRDVVLYGFGRIGRLLARELCTDPALRVYLKLRAIVTRDEVDPSLLKRRASLLMKDSIHGPFAGRVDIDEQSNSLLINGMQIRFLSAQTPADLDYQLYGIDHALLIDNTGKSRNREQLEKHLSCNGIEKVILTAPANDVTNVVYGVNQEEVLKDDTAIYSTASCTTNAITPALKILDDNFGIIKGHIETIHAYTNDQNLVDNMHSKSRRGRAAALNMVITETGAGAAVAKILPQLAGKLTSNAIRVPVANGSLAILVLELKNKVSIAEVHTHLEKTSLKPAKHKQILVSYDEDLVSTDIIGNPVAGIVDACATSLSQDGHTLTLYIWYDNEFGYSMQVLGFATWLCQQNLVVSRNAAIENEQHSLSYL